MKFKKPDFWDQKKPNIISYLLFPVMYLIKIINFIYKKEKIKTDKIKTICVGNIYLGGTGKTPITIKINKIINNLNYSTGFIKKNYPDQIDEQKILSSHGKLFCNNNRIDSLKEAINEKIEVAIFDDGLQDKSLAYDISFVCFNIENWIGNGLTIPAGGECHAQLTLPLSSKVFKKNTTVYSSAQGGTVEVWMVGFDGTQVPRRIGSGVLGRAIMLNDNNGFDASKYYLWIKITTTDDDSAIRVYGGNVEFGQ